MRCTILGRCAAAVAPALVLVSHASAQLADPIPAPITKGSITVRLEPFVDDLSFPTELQHTGNVNRLFVGELGGKITLIENGVKNPTPFLDISATTVTGGERGMPSFTFHPTFNADMQTLGYGKVYTVSSQAANTATPDFGGPTHNHQTVLQEWRV